MIHSLISCCVVSTAALWVPIWAPTAVLEKSTTVLNFGVYTSDKPTVMYSMFKPVLKHIEEELAKELHNDVKIKLRIYKNYEAGQDALVDGKVDFVRFGPASYILTKTRSPGISLLAIEEIKGESPRFFNGVIFARSESSIETLADLKGKTFAFGSRWSTIGRYLSQALLVENGVFGSDLKNYDYLGRHDVVATAVLHGRFDAGAAKESTFRKYKDKDKGLKVIATFDNVTKPWAAREGLPEPVCKALRRALINLKDEDILKRVNKKLLSFGEVTDSDYEFVRKGMNRSRLFNDQSTSKSVQALQSTKSSN